MFSSLRHIYKHTQAQKVESKGVTKSKAKVKAKAEDKAKSKSRANKNKR